MRGNAGKNHTYDPSAECEARAVIDWFLAQPSIALVMPKVDPHSCPNCGEPCLEKRTPYCSEECKEESAFVRQTRSALATGLINDPDRKVAIGQKAWHLLGGGYPLRQTLITPKALERVLKQKSGRCHVCGGAAISVDHVGSG